MKPSSKLLLIICGATLFNVIFWNEKPGVNTILFDIFICTSVFILFPFSLKNTISKWLLCGHVITAAMVVIFNTIASEIAFSSTLLLFISFSQYIHRSVLYAGGSVVTNFIYIIPGFFQEFKSINGRLISLQSLVKRARILLIPVAILILFFAVYSFANSVFSNITSRFFNILENWLLRFFYLFSPKRFAFFLLGLVIVSGLLLRSKVTFFSDADMKKRNDLLRKKDNLKKWKESAFSELFRIFAGKASTGIMALKNEFTMGIISLILLNILLLFVNIIDLQYVWLGFSHHNDTALSAYVHEGAGLLILSIVLAMLVLLFFFRANLNFYKKNKWLRLAAYLWIFQNLFLVISVFIRDYYYISHLGLAYKRIGLLFFLTMVLAGLCTVLLKIYFTKTTYYLLRINAWVAVCLLVIASFIQWDQYIAKYNLARKSEIPVDMPFLLSLSDAVLPVLEKNKDVFEKNIPGTFYYNGEYFNCSAVTFFEYRKKEFLLRQQNYSWLSWNAADAHVKKELDTPVKKFSIK